MLKRAINTILILLFLVSFNAEKEFYICKTIEFSTKAPIRTISTIEVERMTIDGADISYPSHVFKGNTPAEGLVYADNFFLGPEYPKQDNSMDGKYLRLKQLHGEDIKTRDPFDWTEARVIKE